MKTDPLLEAEPPFTEAGAWKSVREAWQPLSGSFADLGYSVEWHDFTTEREFDWSGTFHPGGVEICLNVAGHGDVKAGGRKLELGPSTGGFYLQGEPALSGVRSGGERHQFVTIELSFPFLKRHFAAGAKWLHPRLSGLLNSRKGGALAVSEPVRLSLESHQLIMSLRHPPVYAGARRIWYQAKALEAAATLFYQASPEDELFCHRHKRVAQERVLKVLAILRENLAAPPPLEEIARKVGSSQFHLSRSFTQEMGKTISVHLRDMRMEQAAALLRAGKMNVTEAALEVGYSSLSHFSATFHETFGCCPGLYPLATPSQQTARRARQNTHSRVRQ
jgi:AraC family transcriptional regulator